MKTGRIRSLLVMLGYDPLITISALKGILLFYKQKQAFQKQSMLSTDVFAVGKLYPCITDRYEQSGGANGHYFHQDLLVAQRVFQNKPEKHVDVGSSIGGFVAHLAVFRPVSVFDIRPLTSKTKNITFIQADMMVPVNKDLEESCDSLSCLHALEHFGLGRYGDDLNFEGHLRGFENLYRILKSCGKLYLSVPIGPQRIEFNAHRVFSVKWIQEYAQKKYRIDRFSYVDDKGDLHENATLDDENVAENFGCHFGCGIFEMTKL